MAPDLDVLIFSTEDPLLFLEYHRQFTHSLAFIPIGALIVTTVMREIRRKELPFGQASCSACWVMRLTVFLMPATYGTMLLWPFSNARIALERNVSIIDPLFTLPITAISRPWVKNRSPQLARIAAVWGLSYLLLGVWQRDRVEAAHQLAESRIRASQARSKGWLC